MNYTDSVCDCIRKKIECGDSCGCTTATCTNRQMSLKQSLKLGEDVEERIAWGIDLCTALNLLSVLPTDIPTQSKSDFIEQKLLFAIQ